jgi:hypothetical protein
MKSVEKPAETKNSIRLTSHLVRVSRSGEHEFYSLCGGTPCTEKKILGLGLYTKSNEDAKVSRYFAKF